ncbi:hypothetical protein G6F31_021830 [Rhizopus arrhizus]|nr:hypothetical protein G6F31_021830 [Rhizopus arrhizus]
MLALSRFFTVRTRQNSTLERPGAGPEQGTQRAAQAPKVQTRPARGNSQAKGQRGGRFSRSRAGVVRLPRPAFRNPGRALPSRSFHACPQPSNAPRWPKNISPPAPE